MPGVPVVDVSADPDAVGADLDEICRTIGFFQVTGHGVPADVSEPAWRLATEFFDLPVEDKLSVARPAPDYPYGYAKTPSAAWRCSIPAAPGPVSSRSPARSSSTWAT